MKFATALIVTTLLSACGARSSDEQKIRELVSAAEIAAENRDTSDVLELVDNGYEDSNGFDKSQLQNFLRAWFLSHPKIELLVSIESLEFPADGVAQAEINVTNADLANPDWARLKVEFRRKDGDWQVVRADRLTR